MHEVSGNHWQQGAVILTVTANVNNRSASSSHHMLDILSALHVMSCLREHVSLLTRNEELCLLFKFQNHLFFDLQYCRAGSQQATITFK